MSVFSLDRLPFLYMLKGTLEVWLDEVEHVLEEGDSFWFESNRGHRWFNPTVSPTVILRVNTLLESDNSPPCTGEDR